MGIILSLQYLKMKPFNLLLSGVLGILIPVIFYSCSSDAEITPDIEDAIVEDASSNGDSTNDEETENEEPSDIENQEDSVPTARSTVQWPFSKTSIWNMPIGKDAVYKPANFEPANRVGVDTQHIIYLNGTEPNYPVWKSISWESRCGDSEYLDFDLQFPEDYIVPDAGSSPYGLTPNSNFAIILPDGERTLQGNRITRCETGGPIFLPEWKKFPNNRTLANLRGDGIENNRGQGATQMSALGGTIRLGELVSDEPIRHAIKINPWAEKVVHYSEERPGFKWPATRADNYAPEVYNKNADNDILMGSLFAIPPNITIEDLDLSTKPAEKLFFTLQNYGMYFTEDAAWDVWDIIVEEGAEPEFEATYGFSMNSDIWKEDINKLMRAVSVITNNEPETIGGGGEPRQPLAPDFE